MSQLAFLGTRVFTTEAQRTLRGCGEKQFVVLKNRFLRVPSVLSVPSVVNTRL
jgi:hypothetical protein